MKIADLGSPVRHLLHSGTLHHPIDLSESRSSIEDRGTSVEVFVMLLDNCCKSLLALTEPTLTIFSNHM